MWIINDLNIKKQARELGISVWYSPSFLFLVMGLMVIILMTATYYVSQSYDDPEIVVIAESLVVSVVFAIGSSIIRGIEQVAKINKLKSEFISVASHQLRTPLSAIKWETEMVLSKHRDGLSFKQEKSIENIRELSFRMTRLVNDLLDVAKIDQGKLVLCKEKTNLNKIISSVLQENSSLIAAKNIKIIFSENTEIPEFWGDAERLHLTVENILGNAIKYISQHGKIEIEIKRLDGFAVCSIRDNGVGIPKEQQGQIFDKFFRSDNAVRYQTEGTGLGLYIAKNIIEQAGGKIWFESKENFGSVFNFSVPLNVCSKK